LRNFCGRKSVIAIRHSVQPRRFACSIQISRHQEAAYCYPSNAAESCGQVPFASSLAWRRHSTFSFDRLRHALKQTVSVGAPALLTFHMRHARRDWAGVHCVVVVAVNEAGIHVIDTLGRRDGRWPNATISPKQSPLGWRVKGAPLIVTSGPAYILQGLPPLPKNRRDTHEDRA
jgi:hypothetical protein